MRGNLVFPMLLLCILLTTLFLPVSPVTSQNLSGQSLSVDVSHTVKVYDGGCVLVNETATLMNLGGDALESFKVGFPQNFSAKLFYAVAYGASGEDELQIEREALGKAGIDGFNIRLSKPLLPGETTVIHLYLVFSNMLYYNSTYQQYELSMFLYPIFPFNVSRVSATIVVTKQGTFGLVSYPEDFNVTYGSYETSLNLTKAPLEAFTERVETIAFSGDFQAVAFEYAKRVVTVSPEGKIMVSDTYQIRNTVSLTLSTVKLMLEKGARDVVVEDFLGKLTQTASIGNETQNTNITVTLRNDLEKGMLATFTITYTLPTKPFLNYTLFNPDYQLTLRLFMALKTAVKRVTVEVVLPEGATFIEATPIKLSWNRTGELQQTLSWTGDNITLLHEYVFTIRYRYILLWATFRPALYIFIAVAIVATIYFVSKRGKPAKPLPSIPTPLMKQFIEAYDEKVALRLELERLTDEYRRGRVSRTDFRRRSEVTNRRRRDLERTISEAGPQLRKLGTRYVDMLNRLDEAEAEIEAVEASISELMERYRARRVSREVYDKLLSDYRKRLDRAKTTLDRIIITLRSETRA